jgi:hypothetical protein
MDSFAGRFLQRTAILAVLVLGLLSGTALAERIKDLAS